MHRRDVLRLLAASAGIQCLDGIAAEDLLVFGQRLHAQTRSGEASSGLRVLGEHVAQTVTAAAERIIPRSGTPGATDAGVTAFIDHMLADWYQPAERDRLLAGLTELDARSRALGGQDFVGLLEADQAALLSAIDDEVTALRRAPARQGAAAAGNPAEHWFAMLKFLTVWGYFTSQVAMRETLGEFPRPDRYDGCAPYRPRL
ncbi:MAG: gluconate 2-dehydrogenase subunit 3 family protein [Gemmatimonadetes bacterium]|nr:gluconate 2-dehydrogenase subunit 3 family protein [Gemmatimonadota bacterium]